jgi:hypothetical protein
MSVLLPTLEDAEVLQRHVNSILCADGASPAEASDATSPMKSVTEGILGNLDSAALFLCWPSTAIADPVSYFVCSKKDLEQLQKKVQWNFDILTQEEKHFGLLFAGLKVKTAFQKFYAACELLTSWCKATMELISSSSRIMSGNSGAVVVDAVYIQDVTLPYSTLLQGSLLFFTEEYTTLDVKSNRRILSGKYVQNVQQCVRSVSDEVLRLETILPILMRSNGGQVVQFRPALEQFVWLRETLKLYGSMSVVSDDYSALLYFRLMLQTVAGELRSLAPAVEALPKPDAAPAAAASEPAAVWQPPQDRLPEMHATFTRVNEIREKSIDLRKALQSNISSNNKTHRTVTFPPGYGSSSSSAAASSSTTNKPPDVAVSLQQRGLFSWALGLAKSAASVVTCSAETNSENQQQRLSEKSPLAVEKELLLGEVNNVCLSAEKVCAYFDATYPKLYSSGWGSKASKVAGKVFDGVEAVTTVFH